MKNFLFILLFLFILTSAFAQDEISKRHFFSIGFETSNYTYKEPYMSHPIKDTGAFRGIGAEYKLKNFFADMDGKTLYRSFFAAQLSFLQGDVDYDGYIADTSGNYYKYDLSGIKQFFVETQMKFGVVYYPAQNMQLQPYIGFGLRYFEDQADKISPYAYRRRDTYFYAPLGAAVEFALPQNWSIAFTTEYDWFISGKQKSRMSDVKPGYNNLSFDQESGFGLKLSFKTTKNFKKAGIFIEPFFRYWKIGESSIEPLYLNGVYEGSYVEPQNITSEWGLKTGVAF